MKGDAQKADNAAVPDHLWLGKFAWVATLAVTTLKRFLQVEERELAATDTPTNTKSDGEEPQEVEGWGR
jgi:hypothetical protein